MNFQLGVVFLEQRKLDQALYYFDKALKINPEHEVSACKIYFKIFTSY